VNEAVERVFVKKNDDGTLRGRRALAHLPCKDRGDKEMGVPVCVPGDFTVRLGDVMPAYVLEELDEEFAKFGGAAEAASGRRCGKCLASWRGWPR